MFLGFMSITHAAIASAGTSLMLATADPLALGLAIQCTTRMQLLTTSGLRLQELGQAIIVLL